MAAKHTQRVCEVVWLNVSLVIYELKKVILSIEWQASEEVEERGVGSRLGVAGRAAWVYRTGERNLPFFNSDAHGLSVGDKMTGEAFSNRQYINYVR